MTFFFLRQTEIFLKSFVKIVLFQQHFFFFLTFYRHNMIIYLLREKTVLLREKRFLENGCLYNMQQDFHFFFLQCTEENFICAAQYFFCFLIQLRFYRINGRGGKKPGITIKSYLREIKITNTTYTATGGNNNKVLLVKVSKSRVLLLNTIIYTSYDFLIVISEMAVCFFPV